MTDQRTLLVPDGTRLLHIGPHKTGTTSVQGAFHRARAATSAQGVTYAGPNRHAVEAAQVAARRTSAGRRWGDVRPWRNFLRQIQRAPGRVVISSEWYADANDRAIELLADDLDRSRLHVVVTLRPLSSILPSQWQQSVQGGITTPYVEWLPAIFDDPGSSPGRQFWHRHRHDRLIDRWARVVGTERMTVVVVDDRDHAAVLRVFEQLTGLTEGTLQLVPDRANRSLTLPEAELIRAVNVAYGRAGVGAAQRLDLILFGAANRLKLRDPEAGEARVETPAWAMDRARVVAREISAGIAASGVRVVGDLDRLVIAPAKRQRRATAAAPAPWPEIVGEAATGLLIASGLARTASVGPEVDAFSSQRLRSIVFGRLRDAIVTRAAALLRSGAVARRRGGSAGTPAAEAAEPRPADLQLLPVEDQAIAAVSQALERGGVRRQLRDRVIAFGTAELLRRRAPTGHEPNVDSGAAWPDIGAAIAVGVARASGVVGGVRGSPPPRARREPLELARASTPLLGLILVRRLIGAAAARVRPVRRAS